MSISYLTYKKYGKNVKNLYSFFLILLLSFKAEAFSQPFKNKLKIECKNKLCSAKGLNKKQNIKLQNQIKILQSLPSDKVEFISKALKKFWELQNHFKKHEGKVRHLASVSREESYDFGSWGIGFNAEAYAGIGAQFGLELVTFNDGMAHLYCSPGLKLITDIGLGVGFSFIKAIGCKSASDYTGNFLSTQNNFSLPGKLSLVSSGNFSWGSNIELILKKFQKAISMGIIHIPSLNQELVKIWNGLNKSINSIGHNYLKKGKEQRVANHHIFKSSLCAIHFLSGSSDSVMTRQCGQLSADEDPKEKGKIIKFLRFLFSFSQTNIPKVIETFKKQYNLQLIAPNINYILEIFLSELSGCNALEIGAGGKGLSHMPFSAGLVLTHYSKIAQFDIGKIIFLDTLNRLAQGNQNIFIELTDSISDWLFSNDSLLVALKDLILNLDSLACKQSINFMLNDTKKLSEIIFENEQETLREEEMFR